MANELNILLDATTLSGLTVAAKLYAAGAFAATVSLTESPAGSANYTNTGTITGLAANTYGVAFDNAATGKPLGTGVLKWDGAAEIVPATATAVAAIAASPILSATPVTPTAAPANFASLAISSGGAVQATDLSGNALATAAALASAITTIESAIASGSLTPTQIAAIQRVLVPQQAPNTQGGPATLQPRAT